MNNTTPLNAALQYAGMGLSVFPIKPGLKTPATPHGFCDASTDPEVIRSLFNSPKINIAIATGEVSGTAVIDLDTYADGTVAPLEAELGTLPETLEATTRAGGRHLYYSYPVGRNIGSYNGKLAPHVDVKANGGYVVAAPSFVEADHKGPAGYYVWANDLPMAELPAAWIDHLESLSTAPKPVTDPFAAASPFASKGGNLSDLDMGMDESPANIARVEQALLHIPSSVSAGCDRDMYLRVIWAVAATGFSGAKGMARVWCQVSPEDFDEAAFERDFNSYDGRAGGIGVGTLFHIAEKFGYVEVTPEGEAAPQLLLPLPDGGWPDPQPIDLPIPDVKPFSTGLLPKSFAAYVDDQADLMQSPADYVAVPLMIAAAAALGNRIAIAPKELDTSWVVVPVLWGGIVGRPSTMKSPSMSRALSPLSLIENDMATAFETKRQQYATEKMLYEVEYDKAKKEIKSGVAGAVLPPEPDEPQPERLVVNDSTYQKLTDILRHSPRGVLVVRDELVSLLEGLASDGQEGARGFYLEAWNGTGSYRVDRVGRGSYILKNPAVSIVGGIQPGKLQPYIKAAVFGGNSDDGLSQRFQMLVWPDVPKQWKNVDRRPDFDAQMAVDVVFKRLHNIDPIAIGATIDQFGERPAYLHFTTEAQALFDQFRMKLEVSLRNDAKHPALESHLAKYRSLVPALALVIHLADDGTGPVTKVALEKAIGWSNYLWSHARRVYACVTHSAGFAARALADRIQSGKLESGFTARAVARNSWQHLSDAEDVRAAIEWLTDADWLRPQEKPTTEKGGRSTVTYQVNPKVMNK